MTNPTEVSASASVDEMGTAGRSPVLRAMGHLLVALADEGEVEPPVSRLRAAVEAAPFRSGYTREYEEPLRMTEAPARPAEPSTFSRPRPASDDDIHLMLADARARAHQLIDESVVKAHDLLARRRPATTADLEQQNDQLDRIRRAVAEVGVELRAIHKRLDTIETLLRRSPEPASTPPVASLSSTPTPPTGSASSPSMATASTAKIESPEAPQPPTVAPRTAVTSEAAAPETPSADSAHAAATAAPPAVVSSTAAETRAPASDRPTPPVAPGSDIPAAKADPPANAEASEVKPCDLSGRKPEAAASASPAPRPPQARSASLPPHRLQPPLPPPHVERSATPTEPTSPLASPAPDVSKATQPREAIRPAAEVAPPAAAAEAKPTATPSSVERDENTIDSKPAPAWSPALSSAPASPSGAPKSEPVRAEVSGEPRLRTNGTTALALPAVVAAKPATGAKPAPASLPGAPVASETSPPAATPRPGPSTPPPAAPAREETFAADGSNVTLRISPISGFQGLMRVQDTIVRLREVREAGVEAYARGEARMRVAISVPVSPQRIADALAESLGQDARIVSANVKEHQLAVVLRERPRGARP